MVLMLMRLSTHSHLNTDIPFQVGGVSQRMALGVVVEVGKNISAVGELLRDPFGLLLQRLRRVVPAVMVAVKTQVSPVSGKPPRVILDHVVNTQGRIMALQNGVHLLT